MTHAELLDTPRTDRDGMIHNGTTCKLAVKYRALRLRALGEEYGERVGTFHRLVCEIAAINPELGEAAARSAAIRLVR